MTGRRSRARALLAALCLPAPLLLAACGSSDSDARASSPTSPSATAEASPSTSPSSSASAEPNAADRTYSSQPPIARGLGPCLLSTAALDRALAGGWRQTDRDERGCSFESGRGGSIGVQRIEHTAAEDLDDLREGLTAARIQSCDSDPEEVPRIGAFVCVEHHPEASPAYDAVVGNLIADDELWVTLIYGPVTKADPHTAEVTAMVAVLDQLRPA